MKTLFNLVAVSIRSGTRYVENVALTTLEAAPHLVKLFDEVARGAKESDVARAMSEMARMLHSYEYKMELATTHISLAWKDMADTLKEVFQEKEKEDILHLLPVDAKRFEALQEEMKELQDGHLVCKASMGPQTRAALSLINDTVDGLREKVVELRKLGGEDIHFQVELSVDVLFACRTILAAGLTQMEFFPGLMDDEKLALLLLNRANPEIARIDRKLAEALHKAREESEKKMTRKLDSVG